MKKLLSLVLAGAMALSLTACGGGGGQQTPSASKSGGTSAAASADKSSGSKVDFPGNK